MKRKCGRTMWNPRLLKFLSTCFKIEVVKRMLRLVAFIPKIMLFCWD